MLCQVRELGGEEAGPGHKHLRKVLMSLLVAVLLRDFKSLNKSFPGFLVSLFGQLRLEYICMIYIQDRGVSL